MSKTPELVAIMPAEGRRVRYPNGELLTAPDQVERSAYWQRRLDDGDALLAPETDDGDVVLAPEKKGN